MTLQEGLLSLLNNDDEPLPKRLKIADNAFNSPEVNIKHRELFLLKWLAQTDISTNSLAPWEQCLSWLSSESFRELRTSDIASDDIKVILHRVTEEFKCDNEKILNALVSVVISMVESSVFQHYFRSNLNEYTSEFLKHVFQNCSNNEILIKLLGRYDAIFGKKIVTIANFHEIFIQDLFACFVDILVKFSPTPDERLFDSLSIIIQKNVFIKRQEDLLNLFEVLWKNTDDVLDTEILNILIDKLPMGKKGNPIYTYHSHKLLYHAICKSFKQNSRLCYHFFAYFVQNLGFFSSKLNGTANSSARLDLALSGLVAMLEVLASNNLKFDGAINKLSFSELLQNLLLCIVNTTKAPLNRHCFEIIDLIIKISPLTIEANISPLLVYLMSANNESYATQYAATMCNVFDVFAKLHRVQTLVSKIIRSLQPIYLDGKSLALTLPELEHFQFIGKKSKALKEEVDATGGYVEMDVNKVLPPAVLEQFSVGTVALATKQVSNVFKTFTFHLDELIGLDLAEKSKKTSFVTFIEVISRLLCHYLEKMNIASSNFRAANVVEKITKHIDETQSVLEKFGNALVGIEHNQNLMRVFLQLSYTWGELKILVQNAIVNENNENAPEMKDIELSSCNIAFLHSYLTSQTWCLIAERISNFGEQPCKKIMEKLWIQKIRFLVLSGMDAVATNEHIATLIQTITPIEDYYEYLLTNEFAAHAILTQMDAKSLIYIAECALKDATQNAAILKHVVESRHFVLALLYVILKKLNKSIKKEAKSSGYEFVSCAVFSHLGENILQEDVDLESFNLKHVFTTALETCEKAKTPATLNLAKFGGYFSLIKELPIVFLEKSSLTLLFCYLLGVFLDARSGNQDGVIAKEVAELETILLGFAQTKIISFDTILPTKLMIKTIISRFCNSQEIFSLMLSNQATEGATLNVALDSLKTNLRNDQHIKCLLILVKYLQRHKKSLELTNDLQTNLTELTESLLSLVSNTTVQNSSIYLELLVVCLQHDKVPISEKMTAKLGKHLSGMFTESENVEIRQGELILFHFALTNDKFKASFGDHNVLVSNVAKSLQGVTLEHSLLYMFATNLLIVLQKIESLDEFRQLLDHTLQRAITSIENPKQLTLEMRVWHQILSQSMKTEKAEILQKAVDKLLVTLFKKIPEIQNGDEQKEVVLNILIDFELHLLQNTQHLLTSTSLDLCFATITQRILFADNASSNFETSYKRSIEMLEVMLRYRQALICDRLNVFLQEYGMLLRALCSHSDTTSKQHDDAHLDKMAELAHRLEKLTINLCKLQAHVASVAIYVIADILKEYETITIYPAVKLALNNCVYNLIALCNHHGIACLMRALSPGSTEIFKVTYENYKKYHRFTGKV